MSYPLKVLALSFFLLSTGCATLEGDWKKAQSTNNISAYKIFVRDHPKSDFTNTANKKIEVLAWKKVKLMNTKKAYKFYIKNYPESDFLPDANKGIETLEWEKTRDCAWKCATPSTLDSKNEKKLICVTKETKVSKDSYLVPRKGEAAKWVPPKPKEWTYTCNKPCRTYVYLGSFAYGGYCK